MEDNFGEVIYSFKKNANEIVGGGFSTYKDKPYFYVRVFTPSVDEPDTVVPTAKGINLGVDLLEEIISGLNEVREVMSCDSLVRTIHRGPREEVRIGVNEFKGNTYVFVRIYVKTKEGSQDEKKADWIPTKKGITVALHQHEKLVELLQTLKSHLDTKGTG